jgi:hypothetical protein
LFETCRKLLSNRRDEQGEAWEAASSVNPSPKAGQVELARPR